MIKALSLSGGLERIYYVYMWFYKSEIVYIGKGKGSRWEHGSSGISSCYELNAIHHKEGNSELEVVVYRGGFTESEAIEFENKMIVSVQPRYNKKGLASNCFDKGEVNLRKVFAIKCNELYDGGVITKNKLEKVVKINDMLIEVYSYRAVINNTIDLKGLEKIRKGIYAPLFRVISRRNSEKWSCSSSKILLELWKEVYGLDLNKQSLI